MSSYNSNNNNNNNNNGLSVFPILNQKSSLFNPSFNSSSSSSSSFTEGIYQSYLDHLKISGIYLAIYNQQTNEWVSGRPSQIELNNNNAPLHLICSNISITNTIKTKFPASNYLDETSFWPITSHVTLFQDDYQARTMSEINFSILSKCLHEWLERIKCRNHFISSSSSSSSSNYIKPNILFIVENHCVEHINNILYMLLFWIAWNKRVIFTFDLQKYSNNSIESNIIVPSRNHNNHDGWELFHIMSQKIVDITRSLNNPTNYQPHGMCQLFRHYYQQCIYYAKWLKIGYTDILERYKNTIPDIKNCPLLCPCFENNNNNNNNNGNCCIYVLFMSKETISNQINQNVRQQYPSSSQSVYTPRSSSCVPFSSSSSSSSSISSKHKQRRKHSKYYHQEQQQQNQQQQHQQELDYNEMNKNTTYRHQATFNSKDQIKEKNEQLEHEKRNLISHLNESQTKFHVNQKKLLEEEKENKILKEENQELKEKLKQNQKKLKELMDWKDFHEKRRIPYYKNRCKTFISALKKLDKNTNTASLIVSDPLINSNTNNNNNVISNNPPLDQLSNSIVVEDNSSNLTSSQNYSLSNPPIINTTYSNVLSNSFIAPNIIDITPNPVTSVVTQLQPPPPSVNASNSSSNDVFQSSFFSFSVESNKDKITTEMTSSSSSSSVCVPISTTQLQLQTQLPLQLNSSPQLQAQLRYLHQNRPPLQQYHYQNLQQQQQQQQQHPHQLTMQDLPLSRSFTPTHANMLLNILPNAKSFPSSPVANFNTVSLNQDKEKQSPLGIMFWDKNEEDNTIMSYTNFHHTISRRNSFDNSIVNISHKLNQF